DIPPSVPSKEAIAEFKVLTNGGCVAKTVERPNCDGLAAHLNYSAPQSERLIDEQDKPNHISFRQPRHLAFPDHVYRFVALNRPPGSMEGPKPLAGVNPPFDRPVVLFHDVVQVGTGATATSSAQFSCCLQFRDHLGV